MACSLAARTKGGGARTPDDDAEEEERSRAGASTEPPTVRLLRIARLAAFADHAGQLDVGETQSRSRPSAVATVQKMTRLNLPKKDGRWSNTSVRSDYAAREKIESINAVRVDAAVRWCPVMRIFGTT
jgi:hypothetical protein